MALQSSFYNTDGTTRTYPSTKHIATKQHVSVYGKRVSDSTWVILAVDLYELVNNSIVFDTAPDTVIYSQIEVRVADTAIELEDSPSDIAIVAGIAANVSTVAGNTTNINTVATNIGAVQTVSGAIANVNTVATNVANVNTVATNITSVNAVATNIADVVSVADTIVPNIAEILLADTNATTATTQAGIATTKAGEASTSATNAQLSAWEAEAEKMTADSYATEAEDVFVKVYTSDGDGTFTVTPTTEYSALHWAAKSALAAQGDAVNISYDNATSGLTATNVQTAIDEVEGRLDTVESTKAPLASPAFTGTPTAPTATAGTNTTQIATTSFVQSEKVGSVIQTATYQTGAVATGTTQIPYDDTIPQNTDGTQFMSLAFTPKSSTSKLQIEVISNVTTNNATKIIMALFRDSTANAIGAVAVDATAAMPAENFTMFSEVDASSTSATIFYVRIGSSAGGTTLTFNGSAGARIFGGVMASSITITEIKQ